MPSSPAARGVASLPWRHVVSLFVLSLVLVAGASAAVDLKPLDVAVVKLVEGSATSEPEWQITDQQAEAWDVVLRLPALRITTLQAGDRRWHSLEVDGAALHGDIGGPGLPVMSRLVAVPVGRSLTAEVVAVQSRILTDLDVLPLQDPSTADFAYNDRYYTTAESAPGLQVETGRPAILAGQPVVPLVVHPVAYDPIQRSVTVWTEVRLHLSFVDDPAAPQPRAGGRRPLPRSFARRFDDEILGVAPGTAKAGTAKAGGAGDGGLGTYAVVHSGQAEIISRIDSLLQWRREQGYHVVSVNTASVGNTTHGVKVALQSIYDDTSIPPLEFVTIVGDVDGSFPVPTWTEAKSGYGGRGDHYYTLLDGDDILADVNISRISVRDAESATTVVAKILGYEKHPPMDDVSWYGRALVQGDPSSSGITTVYANQWLKGQLLANGWAQVDTTWSGDFVTPVFDKVSAGLSVYGYRGYWGTSSVDNAVVGSLPNGGRLPIAILPTCDSGSFGAVPTTRSEAWLRAAGGGAVAAIGTATIGTHTRYNNCYYVGTWDALLNSGDHRIGAAHTGGKLALYAGYFLAEPASAEIWAVWNNVMGDGATELWTGVPRTLDVTHAAQLSLGAQALTVDVTCQGAPVADARVCLYQADSGEQITGLTDATGQVVLAVPALAAGSARLTVTGHNLLPYQSDLAVGQQDVFCAATGRTLVDDGDGRLGPGEAVDLTPLVTNHGSTGATGVTAELVVLDGPATLIGGSLIFGDIAAGAEVAATTATAVTVANDAVDGQIIRLLLTVTAGGETWTSVFTETVAAPALAVASIDLTDFGGSIDPGESGRFDLTLDNLGALGATAVSAVLSTEDHWIEITDATADFGDIPVDGSGQDLVSPFRINVSAACFGGHLATFDLVIDYGGGLLATTQCAVTVGAVASDQPTGPDTYGYYAIDDTDTGSDLAPVYDWLEINPYNDGPGSDLGLADYGYEQDDVATVDLPFDFTFYGETYDRISICSNGWLAMGETPLVFYRNFPLPGSHSPGAMIAPFWDDLRQSSTHRVCTWYDTANHRFVVQWSELNNSYTSSIQDFEVLLLDPLYYATASGDGLFVFQYAAVHNSDASNGYATVGIQNQDRTAGLTYSYWNQYAAGAAPLAAGRAILFTPAAEILLPVADVTPGFLDLRLAPDHQTVEYLHIGNTGDEGSVLRYTIDKVDPVALGEGRGRDDTKAFAPAKAIAPPNMINSNVSSATTHFLPGSVFELHVDVYNGSPDQEFLIKLDLDLPAGVTVDSATDLATPSGTITWNGETGDGALTSWGAVPMAGDFMYPGDTGQATVVLSAAADFSDDMVIGWTVYGDGWGEPVHEISGQMVLGSLAPNIRVDQPTTGQIVEVGSNADVAWTALYGPVLVDIDLQRESGGPWLNLATDVAADSSPWSWTVTGDAGPYAVIRVSDADDPSVFDISDVFAVGSNLDWLRPEVLGGQVAQGSSVDLAMTLDATGLNNGLYKAKVIVDSNGGVPVSVPVTMTVDDSTPAPDLPSVTRTLGAYPNPFNPQTTISFDLAGEGQVQVRIFSARGRLVRHLLDGHQSAGRHHVVWNGRDDRNRSVASGVYFYRLEAGGKTFSGKVVLTK